MQSIRGNGAASEPAIPLQRMPGSSHSPQRSLSPGRVANNDAAGRVETEGMSCNSTHYTAGTVPLRSDNPGQSSITTVHFQSLQPRPPPSTPIRAAIHHRFGFQRGVTFWITVVGIILTLFALVVTWVYASNAQKLAAWEAESDYLQYCRGLQASGAVLPPDCEAIVDRILPPPPGHDPNFFILIFTKIKRATAEVFNTVAGSANILQRLCTVPIALLMRCVSLIDRDDPEGHWSPLMKQTLLIDSWIVVTSFGVRVVFRLFWILLEPSMDSMVAMFFVCWIATHFGVVYITYYILGTDCPATLESLLCFNLLDKLVEESNGSFRFPFQYSMVVIGAINGVGTAQTRFIPRPVSNLPLIKRAWYLSHFVFPVAGLVALRDSFVGCTYVGAGGYWISNGDYPQAWSQFSIYPLGSVMLYLFGLTMFGIFKFALGRVRQSFMRSQHTYRF